MAHPPISPGAPVYVVSGLVSRPDLNGCIAVALAEGAASGSSAERIPTLVYGAIASEQLALKLGNLQPLPRAPDGALLDWTIGVAAASQGRRGPQTRSLTLPALIADGPIGDLDMCNEFFAALRSAVRPACTPPARLFSREAIRAIVRTPTHYIYWFPLDAISHYFVLEVQQGHARLFQASVRALMTMPGGASTMLGYSPRDWVAAAPHPGWEPALKAAHARWGGSRVLSPAELCSFLGSLADLQDVCERVTAALLPQLDADLVRGDKAWDAEMAALEARARRSGRRDGVISLPNASPLTAWTAEFTRNPGAISHVRGSDGSLLVFSNEAYTGERPFHATIPGPLARLFVDLFVRLTGQEPGAPNVMFMLQYAGWRKHRKPFVSADGSMSSEAVGWGFFETIHWRP